MYTVVEKRKNGKDFCILFYRLFSIVEVYEKGMYEKKYNSLIISMSTTILVSASSFFKILLKDSSHNLF